ncbi:hypothetical protein WMY93_010349 [Mugilogobius chulae]|uniref:Uncharacterized protein n=1 Tax=Mugilogobius chulae TaxID=88201 RepID=A0AAW0P767_9GOBI
MPTLSADIDPALCSSSSSSSSSAPTTPTDSSSPRRLSWGKLVQRLADFSGSMESNSGSRSDLSDSGSDTSGDLSPATTCSSTRWKNFAPRSGGPHRLQPTRR